MYEEVRLKRLLDWGLGNPQGPISIHIDPTNRCNVRCKFCWQRSHERMGWLDLTNELSDDRLVSLAKEAHKLGVRDWLISGGGEPLVRTKATLELMKEIKKYEMDGDIITNGTFFNEKNVKELVELGWDRIRLSLHSPDEKDHDSLMNTKGSYQKIINAAKLISKWKKKLGKDKPEMGFNTVINSYNYKKFDEIVKLLAELGGNLLNVQTIILYDDKEKQYSLNDKQRKEFPKYVKKAVKQAKKYNIKTNLHDYMDEEVVEKSTELGEMHQIMENIHPGFFGSYCFEPWYLITIRANGIVGSCRLFGDEGDNLHKKSLKEIWYGKYYARNRKVLEDHKKHDFCKHCGSNEFIENRRIGNELFKIEKKRKKKKNKNKNKENERKNK